MSSFIRDGCAGDPGDGVVSYTFSAAVVCGNGINAHTIIGTLRSLGWDRPLILLRDSSESPGFAGCINPSVDQWAVEISVPDTLPALIETRIEGAGRIAVFFTDERYHPAFKEWLSAHSNSRLHCFLGSTTYLSSILDRYEFCRFIEERELAAVPITIGGEGDPFSDFGNAFIVRPRMSWFGVAQRERVRLVRGREAYRTAIADYGSRGLRLADLSFQELLSIRNEDNVSVCGWFGLKDRHLFCTRKVLQFPPGTGGGDLVERISPPLGLIEQTEAILTALAYEGPFEMEFVFDTVSSTFKVTELNPRFWLQHGLIEKVTGCALVSTYLGRSPLVPSESDAAVRFWVNPLYSIYRAFKLDFRSLRCWMSRSSWAPFGLLQTARFGWRYMLDRVTGR